jgi:hypothetical protein
MKASRIAILAVAVASLVLGTSGVAFAAKAPPNPHKIGATTLSNIALNGKVGTRFTVKEGEELKVSANWSDENSGCPDCVDFVAVAFAGQPQAAGCIENPGGDEGSGSGEVDLGPAPKAGKYDIVANFEEVFNCSESWNGASSSSYPVLVEVTVKAVTHKAKAPVQGGNSFCGENRTELPVLGTASFSRKGNKLTLTVALKHGGQNTTYFVDLYGNGCSDLGVLFDLTTNSKGVGKAKGTIEVPEGDTEFFADPINPSVGSNDTPYVSLP